MGVLWEVGNGVSGENLGVRSKKKEKEIERGRKWNERKA